MCEVERRSNNVEGRERRGVREDGKAWKNWWKKVCCKKKRKRRRIKMKSGV